MDLAHLRKVPSSEAQQLAQEWGCPYLETSAKTRQNVDEVYTMLMRSIRDRKAQMHMGDGKSKKGKCIVM